MRQTDMINAGQRIAQCTVQAGFGFATAAFVAQANLFGQALDFWSKTIETATKPTPAPKSWYRNPNARTSPKPTTSPATANAFAFPFAMLASPPSPTAPTIAFNPFAPFAAWMTAWPPQGNPMAWPMAMAMMGAGVPRNVAYPLAEANTAAMDAAATASRVMEDSFSSYRSNGGHASTLVRVSEAGSGSAMSAWVMAMVPLALNFMANWASLFGQVARTV